MARRVFVLSGRSRANSGHERLARRAGHRERSCSCGARDARPRGDGSARRVELGEVQGELTHRDCTFAGQPGQCIEGWQTSRSGERILRRGAIVHAGNDVVWISLAIRDGAGAVDSLAESLATETLVQGAP